jgi:tetratricopeptide (TPR) repeat protein
LSHDSDQFDFFVSYARKDNADGRISRFIEALLAAHRENEGVYPDRHLEPFFDKEDIHSLDDWQLRLSEQLSQSRLLLAFITPNWFASEWCRREWKAWVEIEIAKHILSAGAAPIYLIEVPGLVADLPGLAESRALNENEVAGKIAELTGPPEPGNIFTDAVTPVIRQMRDRRQITSDFLDAFRDPHTEPRAEIWAAMKELAADLYRRREDVRRAAESESTVPPFNKNFTGRVEELLDLRTRLRDDRAGVISGIHGLGGIGKTELAFTYAQAFAHAYPGGRFLIPCENKAGIPEAVLTLGDFFRGSITDEERKTTESFFNGIAACLRERLERQGHVLLILDNVTDTKLLAAQQTDCLTTLGPRLHLLATTRLAAPGGQGERWLTLGELPEADALALLEKHRPFADAAEREAAETIVRKLGGFTLAVELVAAWLAVHQESSSYARVAENVGLTELSAMAGTDEIQLRRHNQRKNLSAILGPMLAELTPEEQRAMEYAALLPADQVPLPWLEALVKSDFPEFGTSNRLADPWLALCERLTRLTLFSRAASDASDGRIVRVHRLVQAVVQARDDFAREELLARLVGHAVERCNLIEAHVHLPVHRWELEPLRGLAEWLLEEQHAQASLLANQVGLFFLDLARYAEAESLLRRALELAEQSYGREHPKVAIRLNNLAQLLKATNRLGGAEPLMRRALAIDEQSYGSEHPLVAIRLNNLAGLLYATNRLGEAEPLMLQALAIDEQTYGREYPNVAVRVNNLAQLLQDTNRLGEAEPLMRRALAIDEQSFGPEHPLVGIRLNNLAQLLQDTNRLDEAEPLMRRALAIDEQSYGPEHPSVSIDLNNLAGLLQATNRRWEAEALLRQVVELILKFKAQTGHEHPHQQLVIRNYAVLLGEMGKDQAAILNELNQLGRPFGISFGDGE